MPVESRPLKFVLVIAVIQALVAQASEVAALSNSPHGQWFVQSSWGTELCYALEEIERLKKRGCKAEIWEKTPEGKSTGFAVIVGWYSSKAEAIQSKRRLKNECKAKAPEEYPDDLYGHRVYPGSFFVQAYALSPPLENAVKTAEKLEWETKNKLGTNDYKGEVYDRVGLFAVVVTAPSGLKACQIRKRAIKEGILKKSDRPKVTYGALYTIKLFPHSPR